MHVPGVGPDHGDPLVVGLIQGQQTAFVFEQDDGFAGGLECELLMRAAVGDFFGDVRIDERIVEKPRDEFRSQDAGHSAVDVRFRDFALLHLVQEQMS